MILLWDGHDDRTISDTYNYQVHHHGTMYEVREISELVRDQVQLIKWGNSTTVNTSFYVTHKEVLFALST